ncbi:MAG: YicC family protein [Gammaproteobacteria bacterium]|nr:YicC family protein [Gammaproteobacteria bacterium]
MLRSMTAFGRCETACDWGALSWEVRSVNHRYLETSLRLPEELRALEARVRERVGQRVRRGKVECALRLRQTTSSVAELQIDERLARSVVKACHSLESFMMNAARLSPIEVLRWPGVVVDPEQDLQPLQEAALQALDEVLDDFVASREREGEQIKQMLQSRCDIIEALVAKQREHVPLAFERWKEKLLARLADIDGDADSGRLEQEMVIVAQKMDVEEELDRLQAHLGEMRRVLELDEPVGRRLDFLMQEFNRESNTLGSKSNDAETTQRAIDLKVLIEQMREQIQNLE